jgi:putative transposase
MVKIEEEGGEVQEEIVGLTLDELARLGAPRMLKAALEAEVSAYVSAHQEARDAQGRALVVRNGHARGRKVTIGSGTLTVHAPRVDDRRVDEAGERRRFCRHILPPYMRPSPKVAEVRPILYLRGLSTGDFREALPVRLGEEAAGLSPTTITRLTAQWETEDTAFRQRDLSDRDDVYIGVDSVHFTIRLVDERLCTRVVMGARADGTKAVMAVEDGYRESTESWLTVWRDLKRRGMTAPAVAVGDGGTRILDSGWGGVARDARATLLGAPARPRARQVAEAGAAESDAGLARDHERHHARRRRSGDHGLYGRVPSAVSEGGCIPRS